MTNASVILVFTKNTEINPSWMHKKFANRVHTLFYIYMHSESTPHHPMITHSIDSYWISSQNMTNQSYKFKEFAKNFKFWNFY